FGAAFGHNRDIGAGRSSEFGLLAVGQDFEFGNDVGVHAPAAGAVVADVHHRRAVHSDRVLVRSQSVRVIGIDVESCHGLQQISEVAGIGGEIHHLGTRENAGTLRADGLQLRHAGLYGDGFTG